MRGQDVVEFLGRKIFLHPHQQRVVGHVAAGVDQGAVPLIGDQELVALEGVVVFVVDEVVKGEANVLAVVEQFNRHDPFLRAAWS